MKHDEDKIDEYTLALFYLVTHERHEGFGARAWKPFWCRRFGVASTLLTNVSKPSVLT
jgi:predicted acetyltransferase